MDESSNNNEPNTFEVEGYQVRENTNDESDPSVEDILALVFARAESPRAEDVSMAHLDRYVASAVDDFGREAVEECVRLHLCGGLTQRMAGREAFGKESYVRGIEVGVTASGYLHELQTADE